jgi:tripartite-type tricarboxylate transporter receptor subunit TctC
MRSPVLLAVAILANLPGVEPARAQEWPSRQLTMVVPFAAGGGADL